MIWFKFRLCSHGQRCARHGFHMLIYPFFINLCSWRKNLVRTIRVDLHNRMTLRNDKCHKRMECHRRENTEMTKIPTWHRVPSGQMCKVIFCVAVAQTKGADGDHCRPVAQIAKVSRPQYPNSDDSSRYRVVSAAPAALKPRPDGVAMSCSRRAAGHDMHGNPFVEWLSLYRISL